MKTVLTRMKTLVQDNQSDGQTLHYVNHVEITPQEIPQLLISRSTLPSIFLAPLGTVEEWVASQRKQATHTVIAYLVMEYNQRELSVIGDSTRPQGKGILDLVEDFLTVFRSHRLAVDGTVYLDKPLDISNIDYFREDLAENSFMLVAAITMTCTRLMLESSIPGNI